MDEQNIALAIELENRGGTSLIQITSKVGFMNAIRDSKTIFIIDTGTNEKLGTVNSA